MLKYKLANGITILLDSNSANKSALIQVDGSNETTIGIVKSKLSNAYGAFGHRMNGRTATPIDLDYVLKTKDFKAFDPQCIEGAEIVTSYDPGIPKGAKT